MILRDESKAKSSENGHVAVAITGNTQKQSIDG